LAKTLSDVKIFCGRTPVYKAKPNISKQYTQQSEVEKGKNFDNKEALILAVRLKALNEDSYVPQLSTPCAYDRCCTFKGSIQVNKSGGCGHGWKQSDCANCIWHAAIALAIENEFPLAFHAPDAYNKLFRASVQRWLRARCPLVRVSLKY
ncbi:hypothetical protein Tco_1498310, partial [Tanacetum coccineum]